MRVIQAALLSVAISFAAHGAFAQNRPTSQLAHPAGANTVTLDRATVSAAGRALYTYDKDEGGVSKCVDQCAVAWPPLTPAAGAQASGSWTIITRPDGGRQWAYKGQPVYTFYRDKADRVATGANLIPGWSLAK